jgi:putative SOS response-associated peptidase YedK
MCSRYFLDADGNVIAYTFRVPVDDRVRRRYNIAPTQEVPVIRENRAGDAREVAVLRWGLVPHWAKDPSVGNRMINARAEGIESKPAFREAVERRRCLVPATGFYEWKSAPGRKVPYAISLPDRPLFAFAGLWETWQPKEGERLRTFTIVTTDSNAAVAEVHDRMPVILPLDAEETWLTGETARALELLRPYEGAVRVRAVSRLVSNPKNDVPEVLRDAGADPGQQGELI